MHNVTHRNKQPLIWTFLYTDTGDFGRDGEKKIVNNFTTFAWPNFHKLGSTQISMQT